MDERELTAAEALELTGKRDIAGEEAAKAGEVVGDGEVEPD